MESPAWEQLRPVGRRLELATVSEFVFRLQASQGRPAPRWHAYHTPGVAAVPPSYIEFNLGAQVTVQ